jgi:plasmid stability protein
MCYFMKNITLKVDDKTYRKARIRAAEAGTSVSAMVREFLNREDNDETSREARHQQTVTRLRQIYAEAEKRATPRNEPLIPLTRDEIYAERIH